MVLVSDKRSVKNSANQEIEPHIYRQLISDKDFVMTIYWRKNRIFH